MTSVFGRIPARFSPVGPLATAGVSAPEAFLLDEFGSSLVYNSDQGNPFSHALGPFQLAISLPNEYTGLSVTDATRETELIALVNKWSILLTGDTAPAAYKTSVVDVYKNASNFPVSTTANKRDLFASLLVTLVTGPYGMVRT